eukprot:729942_1
MGLIHGERLEFARNLLIVNPSYLQVANINGLKYLVATQDHPSMNKKIRAELLMKVSNASGYDLRRHTNAEVTSNFIIGSYALNVHQSALPSWMLSNRECEPYIVQSDLYTASASNYGMGVGGGWMYPEITNRDGTIKGLHVPLEQSSDHEEEEQSMQLQDNNHNSEPQPARIIGSSRDTTHSRSYTRPTYNSVVLTRAATTAAAINSSIALQNKLIQTPKAVFIYTNIFIPLRRILITSNTIATQNIITPLNQIISNLNQYIAANGTASAFTSINAFDERLFKIYDKLQTITIPEQIHLNKMLEHVAAYISAIGVRCLGHNPDDLRTKSLRSCFQSLGHNPDSNALYQRIQRNVKFGRIVSKYPKTFLLSYKASGYSSNGDIVALIKLLDERQVWANNVPTAPWSLHSINQMSKWFQ